MAVTVGATQSDSGNQANSSGFSFSHSIDANTKCLVVVVTGVDASATDSVINSVVWDSAGVNESLAEIAGGRYRVGNDFISIWYKTNASVLSAKNVTVTPAGACTDIQATALNLVDAAAWGIVYDSFDTGTGTGSATSTINPARTGSMAVGGGVADGGLPASLSVSTGTESSGSEVDMGSQTASVGYAAESGGTATLVWSYASVTVSSLAATFYSQNAPTVALNTPADTATGVSTTPDLVFTGTDANSDEIEYKVQVGLPYTGDANLQAYYKLENTTDSGPNGRTLTNVNSTSFVSAKFDNGASVTATGTKYLTVANRLNYSGGAYSVAFWAKIDSAPSNARKTFFALVDGTTTETVLTIGYRDSSGTKSIEFVRVRANIAEDFSTYTTDLGTTDFHHLAIVYDGSTVTGYLDGVQVGTPASSTGNGTGMTDHMDIGRDQNGNDNITATIDDMIFLDRVLTATEIETIYSIRSITPLSKLSVTPDATFTDVTNGADTHPFASGDQIKYTVQVGDALAVSTKYYWRVAGTDPSGTNTYGSWPTAFSFTTGTEAAAVVRGIFQTTNNFWGS